MLFHWNGLRNISSDSLLILDNNIDDEKHKVNEISDISTGCLFAIFQMFLSRKTIGARQKFPREAWNKNFQKISFYLKYTRLANVI